MENIALYSNSYLQETDSLENMGKRWLAFLDVSPKSEETYRKDLKAFFYWMRDNEIREPKREDILKYKADMLATHKASTVQAYLTTVKLFFSWLELEGLYKDISKHIKGVKVESGHKKDFLSVAQVKNLLSVVPNETLQEKRDYAIITLLVTTGLRTIEIVRANIEDLSELGGEKVLYIQGKGRTEKAEYIKIAPKVYNAIEDYLEGRGEASKEEPLFISHSNRNEGERLTTRTISGLCKKYFIEAGYNSDRITAHSLRHTAGTLALLNGSTPEQVQQMLRHKNINTTLIYRHDIERINNNSELRIADAIF